MFIVESKGLSQRDSEGKTLKLAELSIKNGETLGLLGPSGAGKTTLLHALCGLTPIDSGTILLFGDKLSGNITNVKELVGIAPQNLIIIDQLTANENLSFLGSLYGLRGFDLEQRTNEVLALLHLTPYEHTRCATLSKGVKRRLNFACAVIHQPKLLLLDQPLEDSDIQSQEYMIEAINILKERGTTILYASNNEDELKRIATRIVKMNQENHIFLSSFTTKKQ